MYFVNRQLLEERLKYIEELVDFVKTTSEPDDKQMSRLAFERAAHMLIESTLDVGNQMIDGFMMKDPGSYEDIIQVLADEQVLPREEAQQLMTLVSTRKYLVQDYTALDFHQVWTVVEQATTGLECFPNHVRRYLQEESGVYTAFDRPEHEVK